MSKPYRGNLDIVERLREAAPSLTRVFQDRKDAADIIEELQIQTRSLQKCSYGGAIPDRDPKRPLFDRKHLRELADRHKLAIGLDSADPGFRLTDDDMKAIEFSLRFTASRL